MLVPLNIPPGIVRQGTVYQTRGRWFDASLVRWFENVMQPVGGWTRVQKSDRTNVDLGGPARGIIGWRDNSNVPRLAFGTPTKAWALVQGILTDITPADFTTGGADATITVGNYSDGVYGKHNYGVGDQTIERVVEALTWQFDAFGEFLVGTAKPDGRIFVWGNPDFNGLLVPVANSPTNNSGVVVTAERFLVALGADGDPRLIRWADQEKLDVWAPTTGNQAGDFPLPGAGQLQCGRRAKNETLLWTDVELYVMKYVGGQLVYSFHKAGSNCGVIGKNAVAMVDSEALWMGHRSFHYYNGFVTTIKCPVSDFVFNDLNRAQTSKIYAVPISEFREVWWFYPSAKSNENDRYVMYNYAEKFWSIGKLERTAGIDRGPFPYPVMTDAAGGVYDHERDTAMVDPSGAALKPHVESGPYEIGDGDRRLSAQALVPDAKTVGDSRMSFFIAPYPEAAETVKGPYTLAHKTDVRFDARQVRLKVEQVNPGWRVGIPRLDVVQSGRR